MIRSLIAFLLAAGVSVAAQTSEPSSNPSGQEAKASQQEASPSQQEANASQNVTNSKEITIPADTTVLLHLRSPIDTKSARVGDGVYCQTAFPVTVNNVLAIPA